MIYIGSNVPVFTNNKHIRIHTPVLMHIYIQTITHIYTPHTHIYIYIHIYIGCACGTMLFVGLSEHGDTSSNRG